MARIDPEGGQKADRPALGIAEHGHVRQADVHGQVAEPGEEEDMPESQLFLTGGRHAVPYLRPGDLNEIGEVGPHPQLGQRGQGPGDEDNEDPGRADLGETAELFESQHGQRGEEHAQSGGDEDPADAVGEDVRKGRALDFKRQADGRGRDRNHGSGQNAVENRVGHVIDDHEAGPGDFAHIPVERQPRPHGDRGADEGPGQDGQEVADEKPEQEVAGRHAVEDEEGADDEFRGRHVLPGEHSGELVP